MELVVTVLVPWLLLIYLNIRIYLAVRLTTIRGRSVHNSVIQKRETNLAIILITIVLVFFCCHSLKLYLAFYKVKSSQLKMINNHLVKTGPCDKDGCLLQ